MPIKVHENTIHNDLIEPLKDECVKINDYITKGVGALKDGKYTTFWLDKDHNPQSFIEYIVHNISLQDFPNGFPDNYGGLEWWMQIRGTKEDITFHYDKDEGICSLEHKYIYPIKSTITYLTNVGGPTAIFNDEEYNNGYLSYPKKNKHLVFDGHLFHGVIGPLSKIKPTKDSKRITLLINYWKKKPIEPNCVHPPYELLSLVPLTKEHVQLQESVTKEKSKVIKMNYKHGTRNLNIFRNNTPINIILAKSPQAMKTYSFKFNRINVVSVDTYSNY